MIQLANPTYLHVKLNYIADVPGVRRCPPLLMFYGPIVPSGVIWQYSRRSQQR